VSYYRPRRSLAGMIEVGGPFDNISQQEPTITLVYKGLKNA